MAAQIIAPIMGGLSTFLSIYTALLFIRILLSWFPNIDWSNPICSALYQLTEPYLNLFRSIIPPIGGLDLSAMLAIFALYFLSDAVGELGRVAISLAYSYSV